MLKISVMLVSVYFVKENTYAAAVSKQASGCSKLSGHVACHVLDTVYVQDMFQNMFILCQSFLQREYQKEPNV